MDASGLSGLSGLIGRIAGRLSGRTARGARAERDRLAQEVAQLRRQVGTLERQRNLLRRKVTRLEPPGDLAYLFIVTYGRSGLTLLQGVLNAIPGYVIRGENGQLLRHLYDFHQHAARVRRSQRRQIRKREGVVRRTTPANPFFGIEGFPRTASLAQVRKLAVETLLRPPPGTRVAGFKEIRWDTDDVADFVAWLRDVFPGARFVVNTRELADVARSKWWARDPAAYDRLRAIEARLVALSDDLGDAAYHVRYDDYVAAPGALEPLFKWLGEPYDEDRVREVLAVRHSY